MPETPTGIDFVEGLLGWIHERPQMYCLLAGELDSVLHYLHLAWAKVKCREGDLDIARTEAGMTPMGFLSEEERVRAVDLNDFATRRVLDFWTRVDAALGMKQYE